MNKLLVIIVVVIFCLAFSFAFVSITAWLICKCINCDFRWIYPITAMFVIPILSGIFKTIVKS